jgi:4-hydroxybutyrate CoA-transferase
MNWREGYHSKLCSADEAVQAIRSHNRVFMTGNCSVPKELLGALVRRAPGLEDVEIVQVLTIGPAEYVEPRMQGHIRVNSLFISDNVRHAVNEGRADFTPVMLSEIPRMMRDPNLLKPAAEAARIVIAEVNDQMPRTLGDSFIHVNRLTLIVPTSYPIVQLPLGAPSELSKRIGQHIAEWIPDGATMQMGIGAIPDAVLLCLKEKRDLGVHTELFSDGVIDLIETGIITNAAKNIHKGKVVAGFALGSQRLYSYVDDNPVFEFHPQDYVNDPFIIAQNPKQISINSALEVDITGQVCADSIGPRFYSGAGGQLDFVYGASRSPGGLPIIALPATAKEGAVSRIVAMLNQGAGVVTTRSHVHCIVTEHGAAYLYGKTMRQRVTAMIKIAAPEYREELTFFASRQHWM